MMPFRKKIPEFELLNMLVYKRARKIMVIDVSFLLLSGLCLLFYYKESIGIFGIIKIILGILAILMFYFAPKIIKKFEKINGITPLVHYLLFGLQISIVVLAKIMFF
jgi:hypothetical protein